EDVSNACQVALTRLKPMTLVQAYGPYQFSGLARMEQREENRSFRFQNAGKLTGIVLNQIVSLDDKLGLVFNTACGGPMQTLLGMANLEPRAFRLVGDD